MYFFLNRDISVEALILEKWYYKKREKIFKHLCPAFRLPVWICKHRSTMWILIIYYYLVYVFYCFRQRKHKCLSHHWRACSVKVRTQERSILIVQDKNVSWQLATYAQHKILEMEGFFSKGSVCNVFLQLNTNGQLASWPFQSKLQPIIVLKVNLPT